MRSKVRLILSSYAVVVTACSTAPVAAPAPAPAAGNVIQQGGALAPVAAAPIRLGRARSGAGDTLSVRVTGPALVTAPGAVQFTAEVRNGGARRYYYWWFAAACAQGAGCTPSSYHLLAEGEERTSVDVPFGAVHAEKDLVVQVAEIGGDGRTGASAQLAVLGPAPRPVKKREGVSGGVCDWYAGNFYPHLGSYTDARSQRMWLRRFRRDYCGNRVSWQPEP